MGGSFTYKAFPQPHLSYQQVCKLFNNVHLEVLRIENKYTEFKESEIENINKFAGVRPYQIDSETLSLLLESQNYYQLSEGVFDITYSARNKLWRDTKGRKLSLIERLKLKALTDFKKVRINQKDMTVYLPYKGMRIGFGGIGKGYAVDRAFAALLKGGMINFSVNGSGDMRVHSHYDAPRTWKIGIRNPFNKDHNITAGLVQIKNGSVSTSGSYIQNFENEENDNNQGRNHHILSRYKNMKEAPPVSCTIVAENCMQSDVWATITMAMDIQSAIKLLDKHHLYAIIIDLSGKSHLTSKAINHFSK